MKHYKNLMSALGDAMPMCLAWRLTGTEDNYFNARDLFGFALTDDQEGTLKEDEFYLVSAEGAIGIASGYEYLVRWLFIPLEGGAYEREVQRLKAELERDAQPEPEPQPQAQAQSAWQQAPQPQAAAQPAWQQAPQPQAQAQPAWQQAPQPQAAAWTAPQQPKRQYAPEEEWQQPAPQAQPAQQQPTPPAQPAQPRSMAGRTAPRFCRNCGAPIHAGSKFCQGCGTPVSR